MTSTRKWRGLVALVADGVEHGSRAIERIQVETANRPFTILEGLPLAPIAVPARVVHTVHDVVVSSVHLAIRFVNDTARNTIDTALALGDHDDRGEEDR